MAQTSVQLVYRHLRQLTTRHGEVSDHQLVERFVACRDETAFAALVQRHAAMVLGVCRSILHNRHDAEDVFQATFLVLARKAASSRRGASVGSWLYAVASRLAQKARARAGKRRVHELQVAALPGAVEMDELTWGELRGVLHEEVSRLPEKYRATVVLCYWEGMTHEQAAKQLGCAKGTIKGRLERAREMLRTRLTRRGLTLSAAWFAASLSGLTCPAAGDLRRPARGRRGGRRRGGTPVGVKSSGRKVAGAIHRTYEPGIGPTFGRDEVASGFATNPDGRGGIRTPPALNSRHGSRPPRGRGATRARAPEAVGYAFTGRR